MQSCISLKLLHAIVCVQVGAFPHYGGRWSEWNGRFRDTVSVCGLVPNKNRSRCFLSIMDNKGKLGFARPGTILSVKYKLSGSSRGVCQATSIIYGGGEGLLGLGPIREKVKKVARSGPTGQSC